MSDSTSPVTFKREDAPVATEARLPILHRLVGEYLGNSEEQRAMSIIAACLAPMFILCTFEHNSRVGRVAFTAIALAMGVWSLAKGWLTLRGLKPLLVALGAVAAALLLASATSIEPRYSFVTFFHQHLWFGLLMILSAAWATTPARQMAFLWGLAIAGVLSAVLGILMYHYAETLEHAGLIEQAKDFVYRSQDEAGQPYLRARGMLESYTRSAMVFVVALPAMLALVLAALRERRRGEAAVVVLGIAVSILYLMLTKSRGAWIACAISSGCTLVLLRARWWMGAAAAAAMVLALVLVPGVRSRAMTMIHDLRDPNLLFSGRIDLWRQGMRPISEHPWTGIGYGGDIFTTETGIARYELVTDRRQPDLHSMYLQTLAESGIVGVVAYGGLLVVLIAYGATSLRDRRATGQMPGAAVGASVLVAILISGAIYYNNEGPVAQLLWPTLGLMATGAAKRRGSAEPIPEA